MKIGTTRLETFSDGVIAIVITIMILELQLPDLHNASSTASIMKDLHNLLPYFVTYAFSFMMIAIFWTNHHHMFHLLENTDENLVWQNFIFLFFISLIPFATAIVGANPFLPLSSAVYGIIMLLTSLSFTVMRAYSLKKQLVHTDDNKDLTHTIQRASTKGRNKAIIGSAVYLASIPLAFVNVYFSFFCFIVPPVIYFIPEGIDNEELAEKVVEKNAT
jgi:uncharacterized membrane protein